MRWIMAGTLLLTCQAMRAGPLDDRLSLEFRADYAGAFEGYTKVRQDADEGEHLDFSNDLEVDQWFSFHFEAAFRFDSRNAVRAVFSWHEFRGGTTFDHDVFHDGTTIGAGTSVDFGPTQWWRLEAWYEFTAWREEHVAITLLAGLQLDDLTLIMKPNRRLLGNKQEHKEDFGEHRFPMPALGARIELRPVNNLRLAVETRAMYMDNFPTPYIEGTRIRKTTSHFELWGEIGYRVAEVEFGAGARYRAFYLDDQCQKGGDQFSVRGVLAHAYIRVIL